MNTMPAPLAPEVADYSTITVDVFVPAPLVPDATDYAAEYNAIPAEMFAGLQKAVAEMAEEARIKRAMGL
jgi:hypothetical protein